MNEHQKILINLQSLGLNEVAKKRTLEYLSVFKNKILHL